MSSLITKYVIHSTTNRQGVLTLEALTVVAFVSKAHSIYMCMCMHAVNVYNSGSVGRRESVGVGGAERDINRNYGHHNHSR